MSNMSYCRFENTSSDLQDCIDALDENGLDNLSESERNHAEAMLEQCHTFIRLYEEVISHEDD